MSGRDLLVRLAELTHLTQAEAAKACQVDPSTVSYHARVHGLVFAPCLDGRARAQIPSSNRARARYEALVHLTMSEAARRLCVSRASVVAAARRYKLDFAPETGPLEPEHKPARLRPAAVLPEAPVRPVRAVRPAAVLPPGQMAAAPDWGAARDAEVIATKGRYVRIAALAGKWGLPIARVTARWHLLRSGA
jgi:predicted DNA-binding protein (UPF0251 family)